MAIFNNPYPLLDNVLGNFKDNNFNVELAECSVENGIYKFHLKADIDEENILELINSGKASFAVKIENKPFYVESYKANPETPFEIKVDIEYGSISSDFSFGITPIIVTNTPILYENSNADSPMCEYSFNLSNHQIIGSHSSLKLSFERGFRKIISGPLIKLVKLVPPNKPRAGSMDINLNDEDYIQVKISELNFNKFIALNRKEPKLLDALVTLPVLQYTLSELIMNPDLRDKGWAKLLNDEYSLYDELTDQESVLVKCDEILKSAIPSFVDYFDKKYLEI